MDRTVFPDDKPLPSCHTEANLPKHLPSLRSQTSAKTEEEPEEHNLAFVLGTRYQVNPDGSRGRALGRQIAQLGGEAIQRETIEQALENEQEHPDPIIAAAMEQAQDAYQASVALQIKQKEFDANGAIWLESETPCAK